MADKIKKARTPRQKSNLTATIQERAKVLGIGPRNYMQRLVDEELKTAFVVKQLKDEAAKKFEQLLPNMQPSTEASYSPPNENLTNPPTS